MLPYWSVETLKDHFKETVGSDLERFGVDIISYFDRPTAKKE